MMDVSADEMVERLRQSLHKLLVWADQYEPRLHHERTRYDADLDEAEDLLDVTDAWILLNVDRWLRTGLSKAPPGTDT